VPSLSEGDKEQTRKGERAGVYCRAGAPALVAHPPPPCGKGAGKGRCTSTSRSTLLASSSRTAAAAAAAAARRRWPLVSLSPPPPNQTRKQASSRQVHTHTPSTIHFPLNPRTEASHSRLHIHSSQVKLITRPQILMA
jgi:hypothetical protein